MPSKKTKDTAAPKEGARVKAVPVVVPPGWKPKKKGYCIHDRQKSKCRDCGGGSVCVHGRRKRQCKECGGAGICQHNRQRSQCKECGGVSICPHGRRRTMCKECGGAHICRHGREKSKCKECGGVSLCSHGRIKSQCKECGGSGLCVHGRRRTQCVECGGGGLCQHNKQRSRCRWCKDLGHLGDDPTTEPALDEAVRDPRSLDADPDVSDAPAAAMTEPEVPDAPAAMVEAPAAMVEAPAAMAEAPAAMVEAPAAMADPEVSDAPAVEPMDLARVKPKVGLTSESQGEVMIHASGSVDQSFRRMSENEVTRSDRVDRMGVLCPHRKFASECPICIGAGILAALTSDNVPDPEGPSAPRTDAEAEEAKGDDHTSADPTPSETPSSPKSPKGVAPPRRTAAMAMDSLFSSTYRR